jgi:hypothetical protein
MRTTLDIDDDVLSAAKELAAASAGKTAGKIISELARKALTQPTNAYRVEETRAVYGIKPFPKRPGGKPVTSEDVRRLMDEEGI